MEAMLELSATEMAEAVRQGRLSAVELTEAHIRRIEAVNEKLNAVVIPGIRNAPPEAAAAANPPSLRPAGLRLDWPEISAAVPVSRPDFPDVYKLD